MAQIIRKKYYKIDKENLGYYTGHDKLIQIKVEENLQERQK